ncbi:MAG: DNA polymerase III subunit delta, partial [Alphaproteobacteria bacterium]
DALIVAEAGELRRDAALVRLFEGAESAAAIPCYADEGRGLQVLLEKALKEGGVTLTSDARGYVLARLGIDRSATRMEIEKLVLYGGEGGKLDLEDAIDAIGDAGSAGVDDLVYATASGNITECHRAFDRLMGGGTQPIAIIRGLMNHLNRLRNVVAQGETSGLEPALASIRPPIFFKRKPAFEAQARKWSRARLSLAIDRLIQAEIELKRTGAANEITLWRACFDVARAAAARPRRK